MGGLLVNCLLKLALKAEPLIAARAKLRQLAAQNNNAARAVGANLPQQDETGKTRDELAEMAGIS